MHCSLLHGTVCDSLYEISSRSLICCMTTLHKCLLCFEHLQYLTTTQRVNPYSGLLHKNVFTCSFLEIISVSQPALIQTHSTQSQHTERLFQAWGRGKSWICSAWAMLTVLHARRTATPASWWGQVHRNESLCPILPRWSHISSLLSEAFRFLLCWMAGAERGSCFQTQHEQGSSPGPLIYCSPEVWRTWSPGCVSLPLLGVTTPATPATAQHRALGEGGHPGCFSP